MRIHLPYVDPFYFNDDRDCITWIACHLLQQLTVKIEGWYGAGHNSNTAHIL